MEISVFKDESWFWLPSVFYYKELDEHQIETYEFRRFWEFSWFNVSIEVTI